MRAKIQFFLTFLFIGNNTYKNIACKYITKAFYNHRL